MKKAAFRQRLNSEIRELDNDDVFRQNIGVLDRFQVGITVAGFKNLESIRVNRLNGDRLIGQSDSWVGIGNVQVNIGVGSVKLFDFVFDALNRSTHKSSCSDSEKPSKSDQKASPGFRKLVDIYSALSIAHFYVPGM